MTTAAPGTLEESCSVAAMPSMSGMLMSIRTTSGLSRAAISRASLAGRRGADHVDVALEARGASSGDRGSRGCRRRRGHGSGRPSRSGWSLIVWSRCLVRCERGTGRAPDPAIPCARCAPRVPSAAGHRPRRATVAAWRSGSRSRRPPAAGHRTSRRSTLRVTPVVTAETGGRTAAGERVDEVAGARGGARVTLPSIWANLMTSACWAVTATMTISCWPLRFVPGPRGAGARLPAGPDRGRRGGLGRRRREERAQHLHALEQQLDAGAVEAGDDGDRVVARGDA